jgi:endoribonuclease LACTB2
MRERGAPELTACVILTRGEGEGFEVCWERRALDAAFLPGYHAFIGGRVEPADDHIIGLSGDAQERSLRGCALRELCEETGIVLCKPHARLAADDSLLERLRATSQADPGQFGDFIYDHMMTLAPERLHAVGRWTTPAWEPLRYETEFYQLHLSPKEARAQQAAREALGWAGEWVRPGEALQRHARGEVFITGPTLALLGVLDAHRGADAPRCDEPSQDASPLLWAHHTGGVYILPLASPTLPPATHTNAYILGATRFVVIDPGADDPVELARLIAAIERLQSGGGALEAIILTHHHTDHVSGLEGLARRFGALPVWAHAQTAALLAPGVVTRTLEDEEVVEVVDAGGQTRRWRCLWTPGHAPGHLCLVEDASGVGLVGDLIATVGTILVQPPTGHMGRYIESLERVRALGLRAVLPAHGGAVLDAHGKLSFYIGHRLAREAKVSAALAAAGGWVSVSALVPVAYADAPEHVWPLAAMSLSAHLERLEELGQAERDAAQRWRAVS